MTENVPESIGVEAPEPSAPAVAAPAGPAAAAPWPMLVRWAAGFYAVVALFAVGHALFSGQLSHLFGERAPTLAGVLGAGAVGMVIVGVIHLGMRMWPAVADAARELADMIGPLRVRDAAVLAAVSSVAEELLFRGALWSTMPNPLLGTSLLFGLVHIVPRRALWGYPLYAAVVGLLLGVLRFASDSVVLPMVTHFTVNFVCLWWMSTHFAELTSRSGGPDPSDA